MPGSESASNSLPLDLCHLSGAGNSDNATVLQQRFTGAHASISTPSKRQYDPILTMISGTHDGVSFHQGVVMVRGIASEPPDLPPDEYPSVNFQDLLRTKKWPVESDVPVDERVMASEIPLLEQNQVPKRQKTDESLLSLSTSTFVEKLPMYMHTGVDPETETQLSGYDESKKMDILIAWYQKFKKGGYVTYPRLFWILFADCSTRESNNTRKAHISDFKKLAKNLGCTTAEKTLSKYVTEYNKGKLRFKQQPQ